MSWLFMILEMASRWRQPSGLSFKSCRPQIFVTVLARRSFRGRHDPLLKFLPC
jgi:hypothetical protein